MAFLQHIPCPKCNSRDNLAEYTENYYCFGCGYTKQKNDLNSIRSRLSDVVATTTRSGEINIKVIDTIPQQAAQWLLQYGITKADIDEHKIGWCPDMNALVLVHTPDYWQGRNFGSYGAKYLSKGAKPLIFYGKGDILICVEDVISAIKIAKSNPNYIVTPLLGSIISLELTESILERFNKVFLWLDRDKANEAVKQARNLKQKGVDIDVIISPNDPKEYSTKEINEWLKSKY